MSRPAFRLLLFAAVAGALLFLSTSAHAQSGRSVTVKQRDAVVTLQPNGDAQFVETWVVDFQNGAFTFAFREIPKSRLRDIVDWSATEGNTALETRLDENTNNYKFTWYFPSTNQGAKFFSDIHTFTLQYTVRGATRIYPGGDQFWWKFIEKDRGYLIESSRVLLYLPATFPADQIKATTYTNGNDTGGARVLADAAGGTASAVEYLGGPFPPDNEWELRVQFPHIIAAAPEAWQLQLDELDRIAAQNNAYAAVAGVLILFGGPLLLLVLWYVYGRDKPIHFAAEFLNAPPDDTPPGVVGTLLDEHADLQDIVATVADLAQRGYVRIRESDGFGTPEYERTSKKDTGLAAFEKTTLKALLRGMPMRRLDDVRGSFYSYVRALEEWLYDEVVARGYFPHSPFATRAFYFKIGKWGALLVPVVGFILYCLTFSIVPLLIFPLFALELFFIGLLGLSRVMPRRTEQGALAFARWSAFRRYLAHVEKFTDINLATDQFDRYLPYAVAFGLEKSWIEKFAHSPAPVPAWYIPYPLTTPGSSFRSDSDPGTFTASGTSDSAPASSRNTPAAPIFSDASGGNDDRPPHPVRERPPSLNQIANTSFVALNSVSGNLFDFLNTSAEAFVTKPPTRSAAEQLTDGVRDAAQWVSTSSGSSSSDSSWSSSDSSSSSSSWSGGGSSGGGGGGGGSSGFG